MLKHGFIILAAVLLCGCMQNRQLSNANDTTIYQSNIADTTGDKPVSPVRLIVPGQSIGDISIDENADSVIDMLGKPDAGDAAMGKSIATWYKKRGTITDQIQIYCERRMGTDSGISKIKIIRITSPGFKTMDYMSTDMHLQTIKSKKEFNLVEIGQYRENDKQYFIYDDNNAGIAFEVDRKNMCTGIIVHDPVKNIIAAVLAFHSKLVNK